MNKTILKKYAKLIVSIGANVKKGQEVVVYADLDQPEFVKYVVEECYRAGAAKVSVEWSYQPLIKIHARHQSLAVMSKLEEWEIEKRRHRARVLPAVIYLLSEDPDGLKGADQEKMAKAAQAKYPIIKPIKDEMENKYQWCIAAVPGEDWARKMFPGETKYRAVEKLWEAILATSRVDEDPIKAWREHNASLESRCDFLNSLNIETLEYSSSNGTDFRVGMIEEALFLGGGEKTLSGNYFNPNIPTEEVFITPKKGVAEGIIFSTKPLSYRGQLIEEFSLRFENGKVCDAHAKKNEELLKTMLAMDEGASYLGECALVPFDSPISRSGLMFYNTLFDENASCHLALGAGFSNCIRDYSKYSLEECRIKGVNDSMIHEDFMIGTQDLSILAHTRDGKKIQIFKDGNWAF